MRRSSRPHWRTLITLLSFLAALAGGAAKPCAAHPAAIAAATAKVQTDGHFEVQARFDLLAFALDDTPFRIGDAPMNALLDGPSDALQTQLADAEHRFRKGFQVSAGTGEGTVDAVTFPSVADVQQWRDSGLKPRLPVMMNVVVQGHLPPGATTVSFRFPEVLGTVVITTEVPDQEPVSEPVEGGAFSTPVPLIVPAPPVAPAPPAAAAVASATPAAPAPVAPAKPAAKAPFTSRVLPAVKPALPAKPVAVATPAPVAKPPPTRTAVKPHILAKAITAAPAPAPQPAKIARPLPVPRPHLAPGTLVWRYVKMGFAHILPEGLDHILFVLSLFLLSTRMKPLLCQITAFTVAHSLTLALSLYGILRLPPGIIEPVIAASIAFVAIENLFTTELKPWRPFVVFAFGMVHGMGFAGALKDLGLQRHDFLTALLGFNAGVELGQLSVVGLALLAVGWFRQRKSYRKLVVVPGSVMIAVVAVYWTIQRILAQAL